MLRVDYEIKSVKTMTMLWVVCIFNEEQMKSKITMAIDLNPLDRQYHGRFPNREVKMSSDI